MERALVTTKLKYDPNAIDLADRMQIVAMDVKNGSL